MRRARARACLPWRRRCGSSGEGESWVAAFEFLQMLRLRIQLDDARDDAAPNEVDVDRLNELDRRVLKESLRDRALAAAAHRARLPALTGTMQPPWRRWLKPREAGRRRALGRARRRGQRARCGVATACSRSRRSACTSAPAARASRWPTASKSCCDSRTTRTSPTRPTSCCTASAWACSATASSRRRRCRRSRPSWRARR